MQPDPPVPDAPKRHLGALQATALALGMIMSTDTLKTAPTVAQSLSGPLFYGAWIAGGLVSMVGAFCYVEMATAFPDPGGDYHFLRRAWGREVGALFAWSRFSVMHTGWMALMAFMFADYAGDLLGLGHGARTLFALGVIAVLMALNLAPARRGFAAQAGLVVLVALGFAAVVAASVALGLVGQLPPAASAIHTAGLPTLSKLTVAFVYIFLAFGGWSDAATLSAEVSDKARGMLIAIVGSLTLLMAIYLALNAAMMVGLGPAALAASDAPAADLMGRAFGPAGKAAIVAVVGVSAIASINSTLIVGARTTYAAARDIPRLSFIGRWDGARGVPARAVVVESLFAMALVVAGGFAKSGFNAMVDYMTPIYWLFIALSMGALVRLRLRHPDAGGAVRTPF
ncbi:MAG: APC family permease, partial [Caulobacteraceae bacterium]